MKRGAIIAGGILTAALIGGTAFFMLQGEDKPAQIATYWNGETEINRQDDAGTLPLVKAAAAEDLPSVQYLLAHGADTQKADREGNSALAVAAKSGNAELFDIVATSAQTGFDNPKLLDQAISGGNAAIVKTILQKGGNANAVLTFKGKHKPEEAYDYKDVRVITPLKKAIAENKAAITSLLLEAGANGAPFFLAEEVQRAKPDIVKVLAEKSGNLREITVKNMDILMYAASSASPETLAHLIDKNAGDINAAFQRLLAYRSVDNQFGEAVALFMQKGARPTPKAMELALKKKQPEAYLALAQCSPEPNKAATGGSMLMFAVNNGFADAVKHLLDSGADMWAAETGSLTPIKAAVLNAEGHPEIIKLFEGKLEDANEAGYDGETLPMLYAATGNETALKRLVENGGDIFKTDNSGKNMLMYAAEGGNLSLFKYLLEKGLSLAAKDNAGRTAMMYAAGNGQQEIVSYLEERSTKFIDADYEGKTLLMYVAENGTPEMAEKIINYGESPAATDQNGRTALMYAAEKGNTSVVEKLLSKGGDINRTDNNDMTALAHAAKNGRLKTVEALRNHGADIYRTDKNGRQPIVYALEQGNAEMFDMLTDSFMLLNNVVEDKPFLTYAIEGGNPRIIRRVLANSGNSINKKDRQGTTPLMVLSQTGRPDFVRDMLGLRATPTARDNKGKSVLMYAAESAIGVNLVSILQNFGVGLSSNINLRDNTGKTALMYAVSGKYSQMIKQHILLSHGANPDATDDTGKTVLMYAVGNPDNKVEIKMIEELLAEVKRVDQNDDNGKTALMYAAENPAADTKIIELLLKHNANIQAVDTQGKTVLMYAAQSGDIGKIQLFLEAGVNPNAKTTDGKSILDFAKGSGTCFVKAIENLLNNK